MDFNEARNTAQISALEARMSQLERIINFYVPMTIEAMVPGEGGGGDSDEPPPPKKIAILCVLMSDAEGTAWTDFEDCDGNTFKVQTRNFTAAT